jgi:hypothetical protein
MKYDFDEQIPDGMIDRINKRLRTHAANKKRKRKIKMITTTAIIILLLPVSVFGVVNMDWGWTRGIGIAENNGKAIKLDSVFESEGSKIIFKDAVWENDMLLISYSTSGNGFIPSETGLLNENGIKINHGGGGEFDGNSNGNIHFNLENDEVIGKNVLLKIYTIMSPKSPSIIDIAYNHSLVLDSSLLSKNEAEIGKEFETAYGLIKLHKIRCSGGRTYIQYSFEMNTAVKQLPDLDNNGRNAIPGLFPELFLKDSEGNTIKSDSRTSDPKTGLGEITMDGVLKNTDKPVSLALVCYDQIVNWELPIRINRPTAEAIDINRNIALDSGVLQIQKLIPGAAGTSIQYEFMPSEGNEDIIGITPDIGMTVEGEKYAAHPDNDGLPGLSGVSVFQFPLDKDNLSQAVFEVLTVQRKVAFNKSIRLESGNLQPGYDIAGSTLKVKKMDVKNGKTTIDLELDDSNRKFYDFSFSVRPVDMTDNKIAYSAGGSSAFKDKSRQSKLENNPNSVQASDFTGTVMKKTIEISGEHKKVDLVIEDLIYMDVCKDRFNIK